MASGKAFPGPYTPLFQHSIRTSNIEEPRMDLLRYSLALIHPSPPERLPYLAGMVQFGNSPRFVGIEQSIDADNIADYDLAMGDDARGDVEATAGRVDAICSLYPGAFPTVNPVNRFKCSIAEELARITGIDAGLVYSAWRLIISLDLKGDLELPVTNLVEAVPNPFPLTQFLQTFPLLSHIR
jgi:hypothetical protein